MRTETLSQFIVDLDTRNSYDVVVPSNWLKKSMKDYHRVVLQCKEAKAEINKLQAFLDYRTAEVEELKERIRCMEDTSMLTRIDVTA